MFNKKFYPLSCLFGGFLLKNIFPHFLNLSLNTWTFDWKELTSTASKVVNGNNSSWARELYFSFNFSQSEFVLSEI